MDRAEGAVYLAQQAAAAVKYVLVQRDRHQPLLRVGATTLDKWGLDGADAKYLGAAIDAEGDYILHGRLGNARLFAVQLSAMLPRYTAFASLSAEELAPGADGRFSLRISRERPAGWQGPWLPLTPGRRMCWCANILTTGNPNGLRNCNSSASMQPPCPALSA